MTVDHDASESPAEGIERALVRYERALIERAMEQNLWVKRRAAAALQISRYALERRLQRLARVLDIPAQDDRPTLS